MAALGAYRDRQSEAIFTGHLSWNQQAVFAGLFE
jgi:hypothetical protein